MFAWTDYIGSYMRSLISQVIRQASTYLNMVLWGFLSSTFLSFAYAESTNGLIFCSEAGLTSLNPQRSPVSNMTSTLSYAVYDRLLTMNPDTKAIIPAVGALAYTENKGLTRVYRLKRNIHFQSNNIFVPTRTMNAEDVAFSFNRMIDPNSPFYRPKQYFPYLSAHESGSFIEKVEPRGTYLVAFKLHKPQPNFDNFLAHDNSVILSREYADTILKKQLPPETIDYKPIGTGPFQAQKFVRDSFVRLTSFNDYHLKKPQLDILVLRHSTHINKRFSQLFTGECQVMSNPSPSQISLILEHHKEISLEKRSSLFGTFLIFNTRQDYLNSPEKRRAIASLINLSDLNKSVYFGYGEFRAPIEQTAPKTKDQNNARQLSTTNFTTSEVASAELYSPTQKFEATNNKGSSEQEQALPDPSSPHSSKKDKIPQGIAGLTSQNGTNPQYGEDAAAGDIINPYYNYAPIFLRQDSAITPGLTQALNELQKEELRIIILERDALGDATLTKTAQFIKSALEKQHIQANIKSLSYQNGLSYLARGRFDLAIINVFSDNGNIIVPLSKCPSGRVSTRGGLHQNFTGWCHQEFDQLAAISASTRNPTVLATNTRKMRDILSVEMPLLPLIYSFNTFISINKVKQLKQTPFGGLIFSDVTLTEEQ